MGLAASQARYLSLTARKTNVEYEGQQVNQQRTALANQSAGLFNQMLALKVPTPPAQSDYSKTYYTYTDPATSGIMTIDNIVIDTTNPDTTKTYATVQCTKKTNDLIINEALLNGTISPAETDDSNTNWKYYDQMNPSVPYTITGPVSNKSLTNKFNEQFGTQFNDNQSYFQFTMNGVVYYIPTDGHIESSNEDAVKNALNTLKKEFEKKGSVMAYATESYVKSEIISEYAMLNKASDGTGRWESITILNEDDSPKATFKLTQQTVQDEDAYNAAMDTYVAEKAIYEKTVEEINAQTLVIQQQDKTLELHLDQLDTEQQAIQTEMDAIKKVIDKNIEETFKTFA